MMELVDSAVKLDKATSDLFALFDRQEHGIPTPANCEAQKCAHWSTYLEYMRAQGEHIRGLILAALERGAVGGPNA